MLNILKYWLLKNKDIAKIPIITHFFSCVFLVHCFAAIWFSNENLKALSYMRGFPGETNSNINNVILDMIKYISICNIQLMAQFGILTVKNVMIASTYIL